MTLRTLQRKLKAIVIRQQNTDSFIDKENNQLEAGELLLEYINSRIVSKNFRIVFNWLPKP